MNHHRQVGGTLDRGHTDALGHLWQAGKRLVDPVLDQLLGQIRIRAELEGDRQCQGAVAGGLGEHVEHVLGAVDLLFQRRRDRLGDRLGFAPGNWAVTTTVAGTTSGYSEIGSWKIEISPARKNEEGNDPGEDGSVDEEAG